MSQPYHRFVFDIEQRRFVGEFEEMYRREAEEGYDSWHQEDVGGLLDKRLSLTILDGVPAKRVLDMGCGKGAFTSLLVRPGREVVGVDISPTAIEKARERVPEADFRVGTTDDVEAVAPGPFDLVVAMEILSYVEDWRGALDTFARLGERLYVSLYIPPNPIGFVKTPEDLRDEVSKRFGEIETDVMLNGEHALLLARRGDPAV
jgi:SAM-dependent methyltransferase